MDAKYNIFRYIMQPLGLIVAVPFLAFQSQKRQERQGSSLDKGH